MLHTLSVFLSHTHTRSAVILMDSPSEDRGEDRNMMFVQTVQQFWRYLLGVKMVFISDLGGPGFQKLDFLN